MAISQHLRDDSLEDPLPLPTKDEIRTHLDTILASNEFSVSRRSSEILRHVVERYLDGEIDSLKERLLGIEIFHRRSDYDTSIDSIVRVAANDVRRRLTKFYNDHPTEPIRILLPLGSYVPDFIKLEPTPHPVVNETEFVFEHLSAPATAPQAASAVEIATYSTPNALSSHKMSRFLTIALVVICAGAAGWWIKGWTNQRTPVFNGSDYSFYKELLGPIGVSGSSKTKIALSNPNVLLYRGALLPTPPRGDEVLSVPVPESMASVLNDSANNTQAQFPFHFLQVDNKNYTGLGEAEAAFGFARILQILGRSAQLTQARFLNWDAARTEQIVLLGAPHMSAFAQGTVNTDNFIMEHDVIRNVHPRPGESPVYARVIHDGALEDYGLIWMGRSPSESRVLVLAGLTSTGTAGVGEFFSDPTSMRPVYEKLKSMSKNGSFPDTWQVLLRIDARQDVPVKISVVALR